MDSMRRRNEGVNEFFVNQISMMPVPDQVQTVKSTHLGTPRYSILYRLYGRHPIS